MSANLIGQVLLNQFRVDGFVAAGGMGTIYRVWDLKRNVPLAMKVLHGELAEDPSVFKYFQREARALERLTHPNIVPFYGLHRVGREAFMLQRFIDGPTLRELLKQRGGKPMAVKEALTYLKAVSAALGYAHTNGVVHCDVKPGNVLVDQGGTIYLTDFGIARHAESTTTTLGVAGTAAYMAPEQVRGEAVGPETDVYALGVMLFELLTGQRPFKGDERETGGSGETAAERVRAAHLKLHPPDPRQFNPQLSPELAGVVLRALEKSAHARYHSTYDLFLAACQAAGIDPQKLDERVSDPAIRQYRAGARTGTPPARKPSTPRSRLLLLTPFAVIALLLVFWMGTRDSRPRQIPLPITSTATLVSLAPTNTRRPVKSPTATVHRLSPTADSGAIYTAAARTAEVQIAESLTEAAVQNPTATNRPRPTSTPRSVRTPTRVSRVPYCNGAIKSQVNVGMQVRVCTKSDRLIMMSAPAEQHHEVFRLYPGTEMEIVAGPVCFEGSNWWQFEVVAGTLVRYGQDFYLEEDTLVWAREGSDVVDPYYVCPLK